RWHQFPADQRAPTGMSRLEEFAPAYEFNEVHRICIRAPRIRIYRSFKEVTAGEITLFRMLTWIRRLGRAGPEGILNAPSHEPLLEVATRTGFLLLADDPERDQAPRSSIDRRHVTAVDAQVRAVDEARERAGEECHGHGHFLHTPDPAYRVRHQVLDRLPFDLRPLLAPPLPLGDVAKNAL